MYKYQYVWEKKGRKVISGFVLASNDKDAHQLIKAELGLQRLPITVAIYKISI